MQGIITRKAGRIIIGAALTLFLAACLLSPGIFSSSLDVRKDGRFRFVYSGQIYMLPLSKAGQSDDRFDKKPCHTETMEKRPCTAAEIAEQKRDWDANADNRAAKRARDAEMASAFLGGLDPSDPRAAEELAARMRRQAGWRKVIYRGDGLFDVDFEMTGTLDRDFAFPTIEGFPFANAFVQIAVHKDGEMRIDAPGFGPGGGTAPIGRMMQSAVAASDTVTTRGPEIPDIDGAFTIRTDGVILANNTDRGPQTDSVGQSLVWTVTPRARSAPTALIKLDTVAP